jgi:hypothetical protein
MVTCNIATTVNLANGSCGTIVDVILDPRESQLVTRNIEHNTVHLWFPPAAVVLQLDFTQFPIVPGLRQGEAPLFPITKVQDWKTIGVRTTTTTCTDTCICIH